MEGKTCDDCVCFDCYDCKLNRCNRCEGYNKCISKCIRPDRVLSDK